MVRINVSFETFVFFTCSLAAKFEHQLNPMEEHTQSQQDRSAMFMVWNLIADLVETNDQKENEQQQIADFYAKAGATFPRLACLMQLYFNASQILEQIHDTVLFAEGDNSEMIINKNFVDRAKQIIQTRYYVYDKTYMMSTESEQTVPDPLVIVEKEAVITAWKWYEHHLMIATTLFTIDPEFSGNPLTMSSSMSGRKKTLKELLMSIDYNIFPLSTITDKHPVTGQTYVIIIGMIFNSLQCHFFFSGIIKNRPAMGERAIQELMADDLIKFNYFLLDNRGRAVKSYMKTPIPSVDDPARGDVLKKLTKHGIDISNYCSMYEACSIPSGNTLSSLTIDNFNSIGALVQEYSKYGEQLESVIREHLDKGSISLSSAGNFTVINQAIFCRQFNEISNLRSGEKSNQEKRKSQKDSREGLENECMDRPVQINIPIPTTMGLATSVDEIESILISIRSNVEQQPIDPVFPNNSRKICLLSLNTFYLTFVFFTLMYIHQHRPKTKYQKILI